MNDIIAQKRALMEKGYRLGKLTTIKKIQKYKKTPYQPAKWLCKCDCGKERITVESNLHSNWLKSCGCHEYKNKKIHDLENMKEIIKDKINKNIKIDKNGCWIWQRAKHRQGYGHLSYERRPQLAHRVAWIVFKGKIPKKSKVCHKCDVPSCVNPDHLFLGTQKENMKDAYDKGRMIDRKLGRRRNKLTYDQVLEIKKLNAQGISRKELENKFNVKKTCIAKILRGDSWKKNWLQEP